MLFQEQEYITTKIIDTCPYHRRHPEDQNYPGCTCFASITLAPKKKYVFKPEHLEAAVNFITDMSIGDP